MRIGIILSSLGAGLQSLTGAPRLLQAIANDNLMPFLRPFQGHGEPRRPLMLTFLLCLGCVLIGDINSVAPIITMFFLICYMFVNLACILQDVLREPNWRPRFRFYHPLTAALGLCLCLFIMFFTGALVALIAMGAARRHRSRPAPYASAAPHAPPPIQPRTPCQRGPCQHNPWPEWGDWLTRRAIGVSAISETVVVACLYTYISFKNVEAQWGDGLRGLRYERARRALQELESPSASGGGTHTRNWRPQVGLRPSATNGEEGGGGGGGKSKSAAEKGGGGGVERPSDWRDQARGGGRGRGGGSASN